MKLKNSNMRVCLAGVLIILSASGAMPAQAGAGGPGSPSQRASGPEKPGYVLPDGSIQIVAYSGMSGIVKALNALFESTHPGLRFTLLNGDNYSGMASLTFDTTLVAPLGTPFTTIGLGDNLKISPTPVGFRIAHASLSPAGAVSPLAVIVSRANPLQTLNMDQFERIFAAGAPVGTITRWNQLGISSDLKDRLIVPYGPPATDYYTFSDPQVGEYLAGKMNGLSFYQTYRQMPSYKEIVARVAANPAAIGIAALNSLTPGVRAVALTTAHSLTPLTGKFTDIQSGQYPLDRYLYIYLRVNRQTQLDPMAKEYVRMVLSSAGQHAIATEAQGYIPLNSRELANEIARLN